MMQNWQAYDDAPTAGWTHYAQFEGGSAFRDADGQTYISLNR